MRTEDDIKKDIEKLINKGLLPISFCEAKIFKIDYNKNTNKSMFNKKYLQKNMTRKTSDKILSKIYEIR
jgi:hypothetical protein